MRHKARRQVLRVFLKLGLTSFGGPIAHLGYFRDKLVVRRKWIHEAGYVDLVALCQFLPGPASSQVGFSLGILRSFATDQQPIRLESFAGGYLQSFAHLPNWPRIASISR